MLVVCLSVMSRNAENGKERWVLTNAGFGMCLLLVFVLSHYVFTKLSNEESLKLVKELSSSIKPLQYCIILLRCLFHQHWPDLVLL